MHAANSSSLKQLRALVAKSQDVAHLHLAGLERLRNDRCARTVRAIHRLQTWRNLELASACVLLGGLPQLTEKPSLRVWFLAKVLGGDDKRIMQSLEAHHRGLIDSFDAALETPLTEALRRLLEHHRSELVRHRAWMAFRITELGGRGRRARPHGERSRPSRPGFHSVAIDETAA